MKKILLFGLASMCFLQNIKTQDSLGYGLKIPTEEQIKSVPFTPSFSIPTSVSLPPCIDLSDKMPPVGNQGYQGSCVAFAIVYALKSYQEKRQNNWVFVENGLLRNDRICSPSFVFNTVKKMTNNYNCLDGIYFSEGFDVIKLLGTSFLSDFSYTDQDCSRQPDANTIQKANINKISSYKALNIKTLSEIKYNLFVGNPVVIGVLPDDFFQPDGFSAFTNHQHYTFIPKSILNPKKYHAMLCVGYNDQTSSFQILNSWGKEWGNSGYVDIPYRWFPVVVQEAYTMNDALQLGALLSVNDKETETTKSNLNFSLYSSWFKEGYYREYKETRFGLTYLNIKDSSAIVKFTDISNDKEIKTIIYEINIPQTFYYKNKKITFTLTDIGKAGRNLLTKAAYFDIQIDNSIDNETKERLDKLNILIEQKSMFDKIINQQELLLDNK